MQISGARWAYLFYNKKQGKKKKKAEKNKKDFIFFSF